MNGFCAYIIMQIATKNSQLTKLQNASITPSFSFRRRKYHMRCALMLSTESSFQELNTGVNISPFRKLHAKNGISRFAPYINNFSTYLVQQLMKFFHCIFISTHPISLMFSSETGQHNL